MALVKDEEHDVPQPEEAVAEVVQEDLRRHDEHLGPVDGAAPGVGAPEVDPHLAVELLDAEVRVVLDHPCLLADEHDLGDEEDGEAGRRGGADAVRVGAEEQHRDERLPGARLEERHRVPGQRALQRLQLVPASAARGTKNNRIRTGAEPAEEEEKGGSLAHSPSRQRLWVAGRRRRRILLLRGCGGGGHDGEVLGGGD